MRSAKQSLQAATLFLLSLLLVVSCNNSDEDEAADTEAPTLSLIQPSDELLQLDSEEQVQIIVEITDNGILAGYAGAISPAEDWGYSFQDSLQGVGSSYRDTFLLFVPASVPSGQYLLTLSATDRAGNTGEATVSIQVNNTQDIERPSLSVNSPNEGQLFAPGDTILVSAEAADNEVVQQVYAVLQSNETGNLITEAQQTYGQASVSFSDTLFIPDTASTGSYRVRVIATDLSLNSRIVVRNIAISQ